MRTKILILGLICLMMMGCALSMQKKYIKSWRSLFTEQIETIYIFMEDRTFFGFTSHYEKKVYMSINLLERRLKEFKDENYGIKDIALIIHNHFGDCKFSPRDKKNHRRLKKHGFNGSFLLYCHRTNKTYDIEDKKPLGGSNENRL